MLFKVRQQTAHEFVKAGDLRVQMLLPQRVGEFIDQQLMRHARCRKHQSVDAPMGLNRLSDHAADARRICRVELVQRCGDARALYLLGNLLARGFIAVVGQCHRAAIACELQGARSAQAARAANYQGGPLRE